MEQLLHPKFEPKILDEDEKFLNYVDIDGITRRYQKIEGVMPTSMSWPIEDWDSWQQIKEERFRLDNISADRFDTTSFPVHRTLLGSGILIIENMRGLERLPPEGFQLTCLPLKLAEADGAPVRVVAEF